MKERRGNGRRTMAPAVGIAALLCGGMWAQSSTWRFSKLTTPLGEAETRGKGLFLQRTKSGAMKLDPKTSQDTEYKSVHYGMAVDSQDNAWFAQMGKDRLGFVDGKTGKISEVVLPRSDLDVTTRDLDIVSKLAPNNFSFPPQIKGPRRMGADPTNENVWVAEYFADRMAKVDIRTKKVTQYPVPRPCMQPYAVAVDKNHMVWICTFTDRVLRFYPRTERYTEFVLPTRGTEMRFITVDDRTSPPVIWVPYWRANKIGRLQVRTGGARRPRNF